MNIYALHGLGETETQKQPFITSDKVNTLTSAIFNFFSPHTDIDAPGEEEETEDTSPANANLPNNLSVTVTDKSSSNKTLYWVLGGVAALAVVGGIAYAMRNRRDKDLPTESPKRKKKKNTLFDDD